MSKTISLTVVGVPLPKGSPRPINVGGRIMLTVKHDRGGEAWEQAIISAVRSSVERGVLPLSGPVSVHLLFELPRPRSVKRPIPCVKPDIDKLVRAALDGLARAGAFADDSQVCELRAWKAYADGAPGMRAVFYPINGEVLR